MPLPEDELSWDKLERDVRDERAARCGGQAVRFRRRTALGHHRHEARQRGSGRPDRRCSRSAPRNDDVLLTSAAGQCIRFAVNDVRVFQGPHLDGRTRHQSRRWRQGSISLSILRHVGATGGSACRLSQARQCGAPRDQRARWKENGGRWPADGEAEAQPAQRSNSGRRAMPNWSAAEQFGALARTISEKGFGKRTRVLRVPGPPGAAEGIVAHGDHREERAHRRPPSRSRMPTRSCWSPMAAS